MRAKPHALSFTRMLRIAKVWQEFPQQWARYRSRLCYQRCMPLALGDAE
jgi:hypothetical protein